MASYFQNSFPAQFNTNSGFVNLKTPASASLISSPNQSSFPSRIEQIADHKTTALLQYQANVSAV